MFDLPVSKDKQLRGSRKFYEIDFFLRWVIHLKSFHSLSWNLLAVHLASLGVINSPPQHWQSSANVSMKLLGSRFSSLIIMASLCLLFYYSPLTDDTQSPKDRRAWWLRARAWSRPAWVQILALELYNYDMVQAHYWVSPCLSFLVITVPTSQDSFKDDISYYKHLERWLAQVAKCLLNKINTCTRADYLCPNDMAQEVILIQARAILCYFHRLVLPKSPRINHFGCCIGI